VIKDYTGRDYRTVWHGPRAAFDDRFEGKLIAELLPSEPGWFVDVGAGYGRLYPLYARPDRRVVLVDYAVNLLEVAAETYSGQDGLYFVAANAYHLPFRAGSFDAGLSNRTFHHMAHPQAFLDELGRVLRSGAHAVLEYSNKRNLLRVVRYGDRACAGITRSTANCSSGRIPNISGSSPRSPGSRSIAPGAPAF